MKIFLLLIIVLNMLLIPCFAYEYKGIKVSGKQKEAYYTKMLYPPKHEFTPVYFKYISDHEKKMAENLEFPMKLSYGKAHSNLSFSKTKIYKTGKLGKLGNRYGVYCAINDNTCYYVDAKLKRYVKNDLYLQAVQKMLEKVKFEPFYDGMDIDNADMYLSFEFSRNEDYFEDKNSFYNKIEEKKGYKYCINAKIELNAKTKEPVYIFKPKKRESTLNK